MRISPLPLIGAALFALVLPAAADELFIENPSFENPASGPATFTEGATGWTISDAWAGASGFRYYGVWNPEGTDSYVNGAPDGDNVGVVFLINNFNPTPGGLQQTLGSTLQLSTRYTLSVEVGNFAPSGSEFNFTGFPGYRVELLAGGVVIASDDNTLAPAEGIFLTSTVTYTTGTSDPLAGQSLGIRLLNLNQSSVSPANASGIEVNFDDVRLDATAVPEPSGLLLFGLGSVVALRMLRRGR